MPDRFSRRLFLWILPALAAAAAGALFSAGLAAALSGRLGEPMAEGLPVAPTPPPAAASGQELRIVALGDSLTRGAGDTSGGYPRRVGDALRKAGRKADVQNLGIDGLVTVELSKKVESGDVRTRLVGAGLILISIGGNDLTHSLPSTPGPEVNSRAAQAAALAQARKNLHDILRTLRAANPTAPIRLLGLYNPFASEGEGRRLAKEELLLWNTMLEEASFAVSDALVVPVADLFEARPELLSSDHFHPGPKGYDEISTRVVSSLPPQVGGVSAPARQSAR